MEDMRTILVYVYPVHSLCEASAAYVRISVNDKTFLAGLACAIGKHAAVQAGSYYEIIILFHDYIRLHVRKIDRGVSAYEFGMQYAVFFRRKFHIVTVYVLEPCIRITGGHETMTFKHYFRNRIQISLK